MSKIVILTGSAHKNGASSLLADNFEKGAQKTKNNIIRYDTAFLNVKGCKGCNYCRNNNGICCQKDDFEKISKSIIDSDIVVFVTPLYYFDMSAQLKTVIDRFHAISNILNKKKKGTFLITTQASPLEDTTKILVLHYKKIIDYLKWDDYGILIAKGVMSSNDIINTTYLSQAERLGESIK